MTERDLNFTEETGVNGNYHQSVGQHLLIPTVSSNHWTMHYEDVGLLHCGELDCVTEDIVKIHSLNVSPFPSESSHRKK